MKKLLLVLSSAFVLSACANTASQEPTLVYMNNGAIQCGSDGKAGAETAKLLTDENIVVNSTQCGHLSNIAVIAMCGGIGTNINVHGINSADLEKAQALGFKDVTILKQPEHLGYEVSECK